MNTTNNLGIPYLTPLDPPSIHGITSAIADKLEGHLGKTSSTPSQSTSSSSPVALTTVNEVTVTTDADFVPISVHALAGITPSSSGDAKVNLFINGVDYGTILTAAANTGFQQRATVPGSNVGVALTGTLKAGGWMVIATLLEGSHTIALRYSSAAGSASFSGRVLAAKVS